MRRLLVIMVGAYALMSPAQAVATPPDCAAVDRARAQIRQLPRDNGVSVRQSAVARNRAIAVVLRRAAADTADAAVRDRALDAANAADQYASVMAAATSVDGVLAPPGDEMARAVNTMAALEAVCPISG